MDTTNIDQLRAFLALMREAGVEKGQIGDFSFEFGVRSAPISSAVLDDPDTRRAKIIEEMKALAAEEAEDELWST